MPNDLLEFLKEACRAVGQAGRDPTFDGIIVRDAGAFRAACEDRLNAPRSAPWGVKVTQNPIVPAGKAILTHGGVVVGVINISKETPDAD